MALHITLGLLRVDEGQVEIWEASEGQMRGPSSWSGSR